MIFARFTKNVFTAIIVGRAATIILDSSSAIFILIIVPVNAGVVTFCQSIGIVLGANVGTIFSSQIIALDANQYSPLFSIAGLFSNFFGATKPSVSRAI